MFGLTLANDRILYKLPLTCPTEYVHDDIVAKRNFNFTKSLYGRFNTIGYTGSLEKVSILEKKKKKVKDDPITAHTLYVGKSQQDLNKQKEDLEEKIENINKLKQLKRERQRIRKYKYHLYINAKVIQRAWRASRVAIKQKSIAIITSIIKKQQYKRSISVGATAAYIIKRFAIHASLRYIAYKEGLLRKRFEQMISNQLSTTFINDNIIPTIVTHIASISAAKNINRNKPIVSGSKTKGVNDKRRQSVSHKNVTPKGKNVKNVSAKSFESSNSSAFITEAKIDPSTINSSIRGNISNPSGASSGDKIDTVKAEIYSGVNGQAHLSSRNNANDPASLSINKYLNSGTKSPEGSSNSYSQSLSESDTSCINQGSQNIESNNNFSIKSTSKNNGETNNSNLNVKVLLNSNLSKRVPVPSSNEPIIKNIVDANVDNGSSLNSKSMPLPDVMASDKSFNGSDKASDLSMTKNYSGNNSGNFNLQSESRHINNSRKKLKKIASKTFNYNDSQTVTLPPLKPKVPSLSELHIVKSKGELQRELEKREKEYEIREKEIERELLRRQLYKDEKLMKERELRIKVVESRKIEKDREEREKVLELAEMQRQKVEKKKQFINSIMKLQLDKAKIVIVKQKQLNTIRRRKVEEENRAKQELLSMRKEDTLILSKYEMKRIKVHSYTPILPLHGNKNNDEPTVSSDDEDELGPEELEKLKAVNEAKMQKEAADKARMEASEIARKERLKHKLEEDKRIKLEADELLKKREYIRQQLILQQQEVLMTNISKKKKHEEYLKKQEEKYKQKQEMKLNGAPLPDETVKKADIDTDDYIEGEDEGDDPYVFNKFITDEFKFSEFLDAAESINIDPITDKSNKKAKVPPDERRKPKVEIPATLRNTPYYNDYKLVVKNLPLPIKSPPKKSKFIDDDSNKDINNDLNDEDSVNSAFSSGVSSLNSINSKTRNMKPKNNVSSNKFHKSMMIDSTPCDQSVNTTVVTRNINSSNYNSISSTTSKSLTNKSLTNDPIMPFAQFIKAGPPLTTLSHIVPKNSTIILNTESIKSKVDELYKSKQQEALQNSMQFLIARNVSKVNSVNELTQLTSTSINDQHSEKPDNHTSKNEVEIDEVDADEVDDDSVDTNCMDENESVNDHGNYQRYIDQDYEKALDEECKYLTNLLKNKIDKVI